MKKIRKIASFLLVLTLLFTNCGLGNMQVEAAKKESKKPTKITLSDSKKNLAVGETFTLKVKSVKPSNASKSVTWSTSSKKIATVSKKGKVKAKKTGSVTITAKSTVNNKVVAKCKIKVYKATKKLQLNSEKSYELIVGQTQTLSAKVTNPKKGAAPVEWSSSDEKVAKVSSKGKVTAVAEGKATITAKSGKKKVTVSITVKAKEAGNETGNTPETGGTQNPGTNPGGSDSGNTPGTGENQNPGNTPGTGGTQKPDDTPSTDAVLGKILYSGQKYGMEWFIDEKGTFLIQGEDSRTVEDVQSDKSNDIHKEWYDYASIIEKAVIWAQNVKSTYNWFGSCSNLKEVDLSKFDTSNVIDMGDMFFECSSLTTLDLSNFKTENVQYLDRMFEGCSSLTSLDVSGFKTKNVTNTRSMFAECSSLTTLDVSCFETENVTEMDWMFYNCSSLTELDVSGFKTGNVTTMESMFYNCSSLKTLDVSGFDTGNVTDMSSMFEECRGLTELNVSGFDTGNVTSMSYLFYNCSSLTTLDLSCIDAGKRKNMSWIIVGCGSLTSVIVPRNVSIEASTTAYYGYVLPDGTWQDANGNTYTMFPANVTERFELRKVSTDVSGNTL